MSTTHANIDVFEGIIKYGKGICPLRTLVDTLEKKPNKILEFNLLDQFTNDLFPKELFSPKFIINYMINVYNIKKMLAKPSDINKLIYKYNSDDEEKKYVFANNMTIYNDVITICYLYCIMTTESEYKESRPVIDLRDIMRKKYTICDDLDTSQSSAGHNNSKRITWFRIAHSFPSITFAIFHHDIVDVSISLCTAFSNVYLPKIFNVPLLAPIIPQCCLNFFKPHSTAPLALFVAFAVLIDNNEERRHGKKTSLRRLCQDTYDLYSCNVFPTSLKLYLCHKWDILKVINGKFKYSPYFWEVSHLAIALISDLRADDPDLHLLNFL